MQILPIDELSRSGLAESVENGAGYWLGSMPQEDLACLRALVYDQYLHVLQIAAPTHVSNYAAHPMDRYHHIYREKHFDHGTVWGKPSRMLGPEACRRVQDLVLFERLHQCLGNFQIADEEQFGWPGIYWRLVRPGNTDIGPIHADEWFWALGHGEMPQGYTRLKAWLCLHAEVGRSGLRVVPHSHQRDDWKYHGEMRGGMMKPVLDEREQDLDIVGLPLAPGDFVLFHDKLLHGGMPNQGDGARVSLEFTLLVPEDLA